MARVPAYQPGLQPDYGPVKITTARLRVPDNQGGIGTAIGEGLQRIGGAGAKYAQVKDEAQALNDDTISRDRILGLQRNANAIIARAKQVEGVDAAAARKEAEEELRKAEGEALVGLNPRAMKSTQQRIAAYRVPYLDELDRHALAQTKAAAEVTLEGQRGQSLQEAVRAWDRPDVSAQFVETGKSVIRERHALHGRHEGDATLGEDLAEFESEVVLKTVGQRIAEGDYDAALTYYDAHEDRLTVDHATSLSASLRTVREGRQAQSDVDLIRGQGAPAAAVVPSGGKFTAPVKGGTVVKGGQYGASRGGKSHNGIDFAVAEGTTVTPIGAGVVVSVSSDARSGKFVIVDHGDGLTSSYSHLGRQDVKPGDRVSGTTGLGVVGMTGHTSGPHVHTVVKRHGKPVDPMSVIGGNAAGGRSASSADWDKRADHARIDAQDWPPERKNRAHEELDRQISRTDAAEAREERQADEEAKRTILKLGPRFTSIDMLPATLRERMSIDAVVSYTGLAKDNAAPKEAAANGSVVRDLRRRAILDPEGFAAMDLTPYMAKVTPGEFADLDKDQAKIQRGGEGEVSLRGTISAHINTFATREMHLTGDKNKDDWLDVYRLMEFNLRGVTGGKRQPTAKELDEAFATATRGVTVSKPAVWGTNETDKRGFKVNVTDIPPSELRLIDAALRKAGMPVTNAARIGLWLEGQR